jgi:hypothetical protein
MIARGLVEGLLLGLGEEPDVAQVHPEQRDADRPGGLRGPQERAVAPEHERDLRPLRATRPGVDHPRRQLGRRSPTSGATCFHSSSIIRRRTPSAARRRATAAARVAVGRPPGVQDDEHLAGHRPSLVITVPVIGALGDGSVHHVVTRVRPLDVADEPQEELDVARRPRAAGWRPRRADQPQRTRGGGDLAQGGAAQRRVAHDPAGTEPLASDLELWLDHRQQLAPRPGAGDERGQHRAQGDERQIRRRPGRRDRRDRPR